MVQEQLLIQRISLLFNILYNKQNRKCTSAFIKSQQVQGWMQIDLDEIYPIKDQNLNFVLVLIKTNQLQLKKYDFPSLKFQLLDKSYRDSLKVQDQSINKQMNEIFKQVSKQIIDAIERIKLCLKIKFTNRMLNHKFFDQKKYSLQFSQNKYLCALNFEGNILRNTGLAKIVKCGFTYLKQLNLNKNYIQDKGVYNLLHRRQAKLHFFNFLDEDQKQPPSEKIQNQTWSYLTKLYLDHNQITNRGVIQMSVYRYQIPMIEIISLKNNKITDEIEQTINKNDLFWKTLQIDDFQLLEMKNMQPKELIDLL